jgi:hypothetical protein
MMIGNGRVIDIDKRGSIEKTKVSHRQKCTDVSGKLGDVMAGFRVSWGPKTNVSVIGFEQLSGSCLT